MIAPKESFEPHSSDALPNSTRVYAPGRIYPAVQCPCARSGIATKSFSGRIEVNEPVRSVRLLRAVGVIRRSRERPRGPARVAARVDFEARRRGGV